MNTSWFRLFRLLLPVSTVFLSVATSASSAGANPPSPFISEVTTTGLAFGGDVHFRDMVTTGDFNNDGLTDMLVSTPAQSELLLSNGDGTFRKTSLPFKAAESTSAVDLNSDGILDIIGEDGKNLLVALGKGNGSYHSPVSYSLPPGWACQSTADHYAAFFVGDFNGDGHEDVGIVCESAYIYYGDGKGGLSAPQAVPGTGTVISSDFNGDGYTDYVTLDAAGQTVVFLGNGTGSFKQTYAIPDSTPMLVGDFNDDHKPDLIIQSKRSVKPYAYLGNGDGTFVLGPQLPVPFDQGASGDFNHDGHIDILAAKATTAKLFSPDVLVLLGNGDGSFSIGQEYVATGRTLNGLAAGDVDGDGNIDIVTTTEGDQVDFGPSVQSSIGNGDGTFQAAAVAYSTDTNGVAAGDFNNDGKLDFVALGSQGFAIVPGKGDGTFGAGITYSLRGGLAVATGDFNGDGNLDLVVGTKSGIQVYLGKGNGEVNQGSLFDCHCIASAIAVADFNGDGIPDLAISDALVNKVFVAFGDGNGNFTLGPTFSTDIFPLLVTAAEIIHKGGNDTHKEGNDFAVVSCGSVGCSSKNPKITGSSRVLLNSGNGVFQPHAGPDFSQLSDFGHVVSLSVGDVNGDGKADLIATGYNLNFTVSKGGTMAVFLGNGDGTFQPGSLLSVDDGSEQSVLIADFNGDSIPDLITFGNAAFTAYSVQAKVQVLVGDGHGTFRKQYATAPGWYFTKSPARSGVLGDFNGDGAPVFLESSTVLHINAGGTFISTTADPSSIAAGQTTTITAVLSPGYRGANIPLPTGSVEFNDLSLFPVKMVASSTVTNSAAVAVVSGLGPGEHVIQPIYSGDKRYARHVGTPVTVTVQASVSESGGATAQYAETELIGIGGFGGLDQSDSEEDANPSSTRHVSADLGPQPLWVSQWFSPLPLPDESSLHVAATPVEEASMQTGFEALTGVASHALPRNPDAEPPDQALAVSQTQILEAVNEAVAVYDESTYTILAGPTTLNSFFGLPTADPPPGGTFGPFVSDPRAVYDPDTQRWFVTALEVHTDPSSGNLLPTSTLLIAVSSSPDATKRFKIFSVDVTDKGYGSCPCLGDHPNLATSPDGLFVSTNEYSFTNPTFQTALILAFDKQRLANGVPPPVVGFQDLGAYTNGSSTAFSLMPAQSAPGDSSANGTEYFLSSADQISSRNPKGVQNTMTVLALTNTGSLTGIPALGLQAVTVTTETYSQPVEAKQKTGATPLRDYLQSLCNPNGTPPCTGTEPFEVLDQDDDRVQQVSLANGTLYSVLNTSAYVGGSKTPTAGVAWFAITPAISSGLLSASVSNQGYVATKGSLLYPAVAVNTNGNGAIGFSMSSGSQFPGLGYVPISKGQVGSSIQVVATGVLPEDGFSGYALPDPTTGKVSYIPPDLGTARWGDYSAIAVDPEGNIWFAGEHIPAMNRPPMALTNWGTYVTNLGIQ